MKGYQIIINIVSIKRRDEEKKKRMELELENNELSGGVAERKEIAKINQETVEVSNSKKGKQ